MKEKTMRYPGHIEKVKLLRDAGFFNEAPVSIKGRMVRPIDMTAKLLFPQWELKPGEKDITIMRVSVAGEKEGEKTTYTWDLFDRYDPATQIHSMARCTGYTATATLRLLKEGLFTQKGIIVPEYIGQNKTCVEFILDTLKKKNIIYRQTVTHP
jgi:saccharopine dehydrogenase-like NADP-dependent oxidoreductase